MSLFRYSDNCYKDYTEKMLEKEMAGPRREPVDMEQILKYQLIDYRPERGITDETQRKTSNVHRLLTINSEGARSAYDPFVDENVCLHDRTADPRGIEVDPNFRNFVSNSYYRAPITKNSLHKDLGLAEVSEQKHFRQMIQTDDETQKLTRDYLKIFSNEVVSGNNPTFAAYKDPRYLQSDVELDEDSEEEKESIASGASRGVPKKKVDYVEEVDADGMEILTSRSEPQHMPGVGERNEIVYSSAGVDPLSRLTNQKEEFEECVDNRDFADEDVGDYHKAYEIAALSEAIDEDEIEYAANADNDRAILNRGSRVPGRGSDPHEELIDQDQNELEHKLLIYAYKQHRNAKRDPNASTVDQSNALANLRESAKVFTRSIKESKPSEDIHLVKEDRDHPDQEKGINSRGIVHSNKSADLNAIQTDADVKEELNSKALAPANVLEFKDPTAVKSHIDHLDTVYQQLNEEERNFATVAIRHFVKPSQPEFIKLALVEEIIELARESRTSRAQMMKAFDPFASDEERNTLSASLEDAVAVKFSSLPEKEETLLMRLVKEDTDLAEGHSNAIYSVNHALPNLGSLFVTYDEQKSEEYRTADRENAHFEKFEASKNAREEREGQEQIDFNRETDSMAKYNNRNYSKKIAHYSGMDTTGSEAIRDFA